MSDNSIVEKVKEYIKRNNNSIVALSYCFPDRMFDAPTKAGRLSTMLAFDIKIIGDNNSNYVVWIDYSLDDFNYNFCYDVDELVKNFSKINQEVIDFNFSKMVKDYIQYEKISLNHPCRFTWNFPTYLMAKVKNGKLSLVEYVKVSDSLESEKNCSISIEMRHPNDELEVDTHFIQFAKNRRYNLYVREDISWI